MSSSKLYAFAADGAVYPCQNPANTAVCQALLDKSETYPDTGKDHYRRKNYREAAETLTILGQNIPAACASCDTDRITRWCRFFGARTAQFILDFCHENPAPPTKGASIHQQMHAAPKCTHKDNQPLYEALMKKAASYPPEKKYSAQAYKTAASEVLALDYSLAALEWNDIFASIYSVPSKVPYTGPKTFQFIKDFYTTERPVRCPANQAVYKTIKEALFLNEQCRENLALSIARLTQPLTKGTVATALPNHFPMIWAVVAAAL